MAGPRDRVEALSPVLPEINSLVFALWGAKPGPRIFFLQKQVQMCEAENTVVIFEITTVFLENLPVYHSHTGGKRRNLCFVVNHCFIGCTKDKLQRQTFLGTAQVCVGFDGFVCRRFGGQLRAAVLAGQCTCTASADRGIRFVRATMDAHAAILPLERRGGVYLARLQHRAHLDRMGTGHALLRVTFLACCAATPIEQYSFTAQTGSPLLGAGSIWPSASARSTSRRDRAESAGSEWQFVPAFVGCIREGMEAHWTTACFDVWATLQRDDG